MATLIYKRYHDGGAVHDVNHYITDGHGDAAPERTNRYISDGHGGTTICKAYNCPDDPDAATAYMDALRLQYERNNSTRALVQGRSKQRRDIVHLQFFLSFAEYEDVPVDKMMEITDKLLQKSGLDKFACRVSPHVNTWRPDDPENPGNKHVHISLCPYALDGKHKLSMTHNRLWNLQKELDYLCAENGYSIICKPILLDDPEYRAWYDGIAKEGKITIHPPQPDKRNKRTNKSKEKNQDAAERDKDKLKKRSEIRAYNLMRRLDIRTPKEFERHVKKIGSEIGELRKEIAYQSRVLDSIEPQIALIHHAESMDISTPKEVAERLRVASEADIEAVKKKYRRAKDRKALCEKRLNDRKKEYRNLKNAKNALGPELWNAISADTNSPSVGYIEQEHFHNILAAADAKIAEDRQRLIEQEKAENRNWYINTAFNRPYRVPRYYPDKTEHSILELIILLILVKMDYDIDPYPDTPSPEDLDEIEAERKKEAAAAKARIYRIQLMVDALATHREEDVTTIEQINERIESVGYQIGESKSEYERSELKARYRKLQRLKEAYYLSDIPYYERYEYVDYNYDEPAEKAEPPKKLSSFDSLLADAMSRAGKPQASKKKNLDLEK